MQDGKQANGKRKYIIANLCYGLGKTPYVDLWLENQLKSLCDPTNIPALRDEWDVEYLLFTDQESFQGINRHPNFMRLGQVASIDVVHLQWPADADQFGSRYSLLVQIFHEALRKALESKAYALSVIVADLVYAKDALPRILKRLTSGHDAVLMVPIRSAAESVMPALMKMPGAPSDLELFELAYRNLHHLWTHATVGNPYFTRMPYSMLWKSPAGLLAHNFGITPIAFRPSEALRGVQGVIDSDVPSFFTNPYWATDWTDAPVAGVEPLANGHYPPFGGSSDPAAIAAWSRIGTQPVQARYLDRPLFYPSRQTFDAPALEESALNFVTEIKNQLGELNGKTN